MKNCFCADREGVHRSDERASIHRAIAKPLRELRTEESIMRHQGDQIRADVIKRAIRGIDAATRAHRKAKP